MKQSDSEKRELPSSIDPDDWMETANEIKKIDAISVREESGVQLVSSLSDRTAEWLPDPVLLHDDYSSLISRPTASDFVFAYSPSAQSAIYRFQNKIARMLHVPMIVPYDSRPYALTHTNVISLGPSEWLGYLAQSRIVVTNSFHGVMFSILFRKPFIAVALRGAKKELNERFASTLSRLGLLKYLLTGDEPDAEVQRLIAAEPDWDAVHARIHEWREEAMVFLRENVQRRGENR